MLREHGITLAGPDPASLVEPVSAAQLRDDVLTAMREWADWADELAMSRRAQELLVLSYCRMLHVLASGKVTSKREAGQWALGALDEEWTSLIERALGDRPDPWGRVRQRADAETVDRTLAFIRYALAVARPLTARPAPPSEDGRAMRLPF
ncbi:MAG: aminoglycoside adenylyltransferase domain-containing protein [Gaiellaceae bacterium]